MLYIPISCKTIFPNISRYPHYKAIEQINNLNIPTKLIQTCVPSSHCKIHWMYHILSYLQGPFLSPARTAVAYEKPGQLRSREPQDSPWVNWQFAIENGHSYSGYCKFERCTNHRSSPICRLVWLLWLLIWRTMVNTRQHQFQGKKHVDCNVNPWLINPNGCLLGGDTISVAKCYCLREPPQLTNQGFLIRGWH